MMVSNPPLSGPSLHLSWKELACKDGTPYPEEWRNSRALVIAEAFEIIRELAGGKPIKINSAYRTPTYNKKIGGAKNSQHIHGRALDLVPPKGMSIKDFHRLIVDISRVYKTIRGVGLYKTFVHVDIRLSEFLVVWDHSADKNAGNA